MCVCVLHKMLTVSYTFLTTVRKYQAKVNNISAQRTFNLYRLAKLSAVGFSLDTSVSLSLTVCKVKNIDARSAMTKENSAKDFGIEKTKGGLRFIQHSFCILVVYLNSIYTLFSSVFNYYYSYIIYCYRYKSIVCIHILLPPYMPLLSLSVAEILGLLPLCSLQQ